MRPGALEASLVASTIAAVPSESAIWLTFDDGPSPGSTEPILDVLENRCVRATFFVCGVMAERYPQIVARASASGHEIANHAWSHVPLTPVEDRELDLEITRTSDVIERVTGTRPRHFRPPYGRLDRRVVDRARAAGLETVLWNRLGYDWTGIGAEAIAEHILTGLRPGEILVLHDGCGDRCWGGPLPPLSVDRGATLEALPRILDGILERRLDVLSPDQIGPVPRVGR
ncbi:MAG: polysaccharide deacetylase family protein [Planctomycetes bacterium]|nr:polysaccharide deacetylase family protein [Planctomycetota bacterium]